MSVESEISPWLGKTILVVDDYPSVRRTVCELIRGLDMLAVEAENGVEALAVIRRGGVDLVITDLVMPEMDGFELTENLRAMPGFRSLPIVVISTHDDAKYIFRALHLGADDYIVKPPSAEMLRIVLARLFDHSW